MSIDSAESETYTIKGTLCTVNGNDGIFVESIAPAAET